MTYLATPPGRPGGEEGRMDAKDECHLLFVPVRESGSGVLALRTARLPSGQRVGLAYTSAATLLAALGPSQPWIRLHEDAMRDMLEPAGIGQIRVDALPFAPPDTTAAVDELGTKNSVSRTETDVLRDVRPVPCCGNVAGTMRHLVLIACRSGA
jgi:hypothetical protein